MHPCTYAYVRVVVLWQCNMKSLLALEAISPGVFISFFPLICCPQTEEVLKWDLTGCFLSGLCVCLAGVGMWVGVFLPKYAFYRQSEDILASVDIFWCGLRPKRQKGGGSIRKLLQSFITQLRMDYWALEHINTCTANIFSNMVRFATTGLLFV